MELTGRQAQFINHRLTPKRREVFDAMLTEVAAGRWEEVPGTNAWLTIRWMAERKVHPAHRIPEKTWHEIVFAHLLVGGSFSLGRCAGPQSGRQDSDLTVGKALAVVRDPVTALGLDPVPVLRWRLVWQDGTPEPGPSYEREDQVLPVKYTDGIVPGHAARHACDGVVEHDGRMNPLACRNCGPGVRGRDVVFHPYRTEIFEEVPE